MEGHCREVGEARGGVAGLVCWWLTSGSKCGVLLGFDTLCRGCSSSETAVEELFRCYVQRHGRLGVRAHSSCDSWFSMPTCIEIRVLSWEQACVQRWAVFAPRQQHCVRSWRECARQCYQLELSCSPSISGQCREHIGHYRTHVDCVWP